MSLCATVPLREDPVPGSLNSSQDANPPETGTILRKWYAAFTLTQHEKRIAERCQQRRVEYFLPLYKLRRKWKNRQTVDLELPLFPNYLFVHIAAAERVRVLELPGVISIVSSSGQPLSIADEYITSLSDGLLVHKIEPHLNLEAGECVRIKSGPLAGAEGILERYRNDLRVVLKLEMLARSVSVEVGADEIQRCGTKLS